MRNGLHQWTVVHHYEKPVIIREVGFMTKRQALAELKMQISADRKTTQHSIVYRDGVPVYHRFWGVRHINRL
jgi:hypothetical protein